MTTKTLAALTREANELRVRTEVEIARAHGAALESGDADAVKDAITAFDALAAVLTPTNTTAAVARAAAKSLRGRLLLLLTDRWQ
jgi:hypothetical protein